MHSGSGACIGTMPLQPMNSLHLLPGIHVRTQLYVRHWRLLDFLHAGTVCYEAWLFHPVWLAS